MKDIVPHETSCWQQIEQTLADSVASYGYQQIRLPLLENTALFQRSIGEVTDIVEKEMYTFADRNGDSVTLRPEGTASCVRACIEHNLLYRATPRLWYTGPMFRYERPQKGRYRQFHHFGVEAYGFSGPDIEIELLSMSARFWRTLGLDNAIKLELNSLGTLEERSRYREALIAYLQDNYAILDEDSQRRLISNPLRILDSKNPALQTCIKNAPQLIAYLGEPSLKHLEAITDQLTRLKIQWQLNPRLVRGLDYYCHTVFEWVTNELGAQGTVCAGGRYDHLVEQLGGRPTPAVGFAIGLERLILLYQQYFVPQMDLPLSIYMIHDGGLTQQLAHELAEKIRNELPRVQLIVHCGGGSFKNQFKQADKLGATIALILGTNEVEKQEVGVKFLREDRVQQVVKTTQLSYYLSSLINT